MKVKCKNCYPPEGIDVPDFSQTEKSKLWRLRTESPIHSVKYLMDNFELSHLNAKYIATHITKKYGHCNKCSFDKLKGEYINCPKCEALNFNWRMDD